MAKIRFACLGLCAILGLFSPLGTSSSQVAPRETTVRNAKSVALCDLASGPETYVGVNVEVKAVLRQELLKPSGLISSRCPERILLVLMECDPLEKCSMIRKKIDSNLSDSPDGVAQEVELIVSGMIKKQPNFNYNYRGAVRDYVLIINDVTLPHARDDF